MTDKSAPGAEHTPGLADEDFWRYLKNNASIDSLYKTAHDLAAENERLKACLAVFRHSWYHDASPSAQAIRDANELLGSYPASGEP